MPRRHYPFIRFQYPGVPADQRPHTCVPIRVINPANNRSLFGYGLLDTGADSSLFPADLATALGHDLKSTGVKSNVMCGIEQTSVTTYQHTFRIELLSSNFQNVVWTSGAIEIDCAESNPPIILGVSDFLRHFTLTIDYHREQISLEW